MLDWYPLPSNSDHQDPSVSSRSFRKTFHCFWGGGHTQLIPSPADLSSTQATGIRRTTSGIRQAWRIWEVARLDHFRLSPFSNWHSTRGGTFKTYLQLMNTPNFACPAPQRVWFLFVSFVHTLPPFFSLPFPLRPIETPLAGRRFAVCYCYCQSNQNSRSFKKLFLKVAKIALNKNLTSFTSKTDWRFPDWRPFLLLLEILLTLNDPTSLPPLTLQR